jgi:hypothetical protein
MFERLTTLQEAHNHEISVHENLILDARAMGPEVAAVLRAHGPASRGGGVGHPLGAAR